MKLSALEEKPSQPKLIFVVGVWRSGTSLLYTLLQNHPRIALTYEAEPLALFSRTAGAVWPDDWSTRLEFFNRTFSRHRLDTAELPVRKGARESMLKLFAAWATRKDATIMGGKSPSYHRFLVDVARIFPEADFIIIWRDPLDICRSVMNAGRNDRFFRRKGILREVLFGSERMAKGVRNLRSAGRRVHEVVYEELICTPEAELRKICAFAGLEFDPQMLDLKSADQSMLPPGEHHTRVRSGVVQPTRGRTGTLPAKFITKSTRYLALWRKGYSDLAFARVLPELSVTGHPGHLEKLADAGIYRGLLLWVDLRYLVLRKMPLSVWRRWRTDATFEALNNSADKVA